MLLVLLHKQCEMKYDDVVKDFVDAMIYFSKLWLKLSQWNNRLGLQAWKIMQNMTRLIACFNVGHVQKYLSTKIMTQIAQENGEVDYKWL